MSFWTDTRTDIAVKLWASRRHTSGQIGDYLGCGPEQLAAKMSRLGVEGGVGKGRRGEPLDLTLRALGLPAVCEA